MWCSNPCEHRRDKSSSQFIFTCVGFLISPGLKCLEHTFVASVNLKYIPPSTSLTEGHRSERYFASIFMTAASLCAFWHTEVSGHFVLDNYMLLQSVIKLNWTDIYCTKIKQSTPFEPVICLQLKQNTASLCFHTKINPSLARHRPWWKLHMKEPCTQFVGNLIGGQMVKLKPCIMHLWISWKNKTSAAELNLWD